MLSPTRKIYIYFVAALRQLTEFRDVYDSIDDMLRERLICGINDVWIQHCLLGSLDFKTGIWNIVSYGTADCNWVVCTRWLPFVGITCCIPQQGKDIFLNALYQIHPGASRTNALILARSYFWCPHMVLISKERWKYMNLVRWIGTFHSHHSYIFGQVQ